MYYLPFSNLGGRPLITVSTVANIVLVNLFQNVYHIQLIYVEISLPLSYAQLIIDTVDLPSSNERIA